MRHFDPQILPCTHYWQRNGAFIPGATNGSYTTNNVPFSASGSQYSCLVSNAYGTLLSSNAVLSVIPPLPCYPPPAGLVSWWKGDGNALDQTGSNNGALAGVASYGPGEVGQGFVFSTQGAAVKVGYATNLQLQTFTIEAWIQRSNTNTVSWRPLLDGHFFGFGYGGYAFGLNSGNHLFVTRIGIDQVLSSATVTDANWHHVAMTKVGTTLVFYLDGVSYPAPAYSTTYTFSTPAAIGARADNLDNNFMGTVDELAIYNRALATNEIVAIYSAGSGGKCVAPAPAVITAQPTNETVLVGATASFNVTATGSLPLSYYWQCNGAFIPGATNASYTTNNVPLSASGSQYSCLVSNAYGTAVSSNAVLTALAVPPSIPQQPTNQVIFVGGNASFRLVAVGSLPLNYYWFCNGSLIPGATNSTYATNNVPLSASGGQYDCLVGNAYGTALSSNATLTVMGLPPSIIQQPINQTIGTGGTAFFSVAAAGTPPFSYYWFCNGALIPGASNSTCAIVSAPLSASGNQYGCLIGNPFGSALSSNATLTVLLPPTVTQQPGSCTNNAGTTAIFAVSFGGAAPLGCQWIKNATNYLTDGGNVSGSATATLTLSGVLGADAGNYAALVTNQVGSMLSSNAVLTVIDPVILSQPQSQTVLLSSNALFAVTAAGTALQYQWMLNGSNLPNATDSSFSINPVMASDNGAAYSVAVSNAFGDVVSSNAVLTVVAGQLANPLQDSNGFFEASLVGVPASNFVILVSTDLYNWTPLMTNAAAEGILSIVDTNAFDLTQPCLFYRAVLAP